MPRARQHSPATQGSAACPRVKAACCHSRRICAPPSSATAGQTTLAPLTAAGGVLHITSRQREVLRFTITAPANDTRRVLLEIPKEGDRTLSIEGGAIPGTEETAAAWR